MEIISGYAELPVGSYQKIMEAMSDDGMSDLDKHVRVMSILTGQDEDALLELPVGDFTELSMKMKFLEREPDGKVDMRKSFAVGDYVLVPVDDMRKMTAAQYIDFQTLCRDRSKIVETLSCLLVPNGKRYAKDYDIVDVQGAIADNMSVMDALSAYAFFFASLKKSMRAILSCSRKVLAGTELTKEKKTELGRLLRKAEALLRGNGGGSPVSMPSARSAAANGTRSGK